MIRTTLVVAGGLLVLAACERTPPADLVVTGVVVWTGDPAAPRAEALAVRDGSIVAVGDAGAVASLIGDETEVLEHDGGMLVPGFIDSHVHMQWGGTGLAGVQLRDATSREALASRLADFAAGLEPGEWIVSGLWDHYNWGGELPRRDWIDAATPDNPVFVIRLDGHMALANSVALELAGVDASTADVDGGEIIRDADGAPTGILKDKAMVLVQNAIPPPSDAQMDRIVQAATRHLARQGITTAHDMGDWKSVAAFRRAHERGDLETRIYAMVPLPEQEALAERIAADGNGDAWVRIGGVKEFMDGSLGSHTAAFLEPYADAPDDHGLWMNEPGQMAEWIAAADGRGLHVLIHAIGDRANRTLLDIFEDAADRNGPRDRRFRIEHAQHIHPDDVDRFAALNVIASMQPYHAIDDGRWADRVIGEERSRTTYAFESLLHSGAVLAFGSDWPIAPASPLEGIYAAVTRRTLDGANPDGWVPNQRIGVEQALAAYTAGGAYAAHQEGEKGTLAVGKLADFVLLDRDITAVPPAEIREAKVLATVVAGRTVYRADNSVD